MIRRVVFTDAERFDAGFDQQLETLPQTVVVLEPYAHDPGVDNQLCTSQAWLMCGPELGPFYGHTMTSGEDDGISLSVHRSLTTLVVVGMTAVDGTSDIPVVARRDDP